MIKIRKKEKPAIKDILFEADRLNKDEQKAALDLIFSDRYNPVVDTEHMTNTAQRAQLQQIVEEDQNKPLVGANRARYVKLQALPTTAHPEQNRYVILDVRRLHGYLNRISNYLSQYFPSYSLVYNRMIIQYTYDVPTMATDDYRIFINPSFLVYLLEECGINGPITIIIHEIFHVLMKHKTRRQRQIWNFPDHFQSNIAMDYEINYLISNQNDKLPFKEVFQKAHALLDDKYAGMMWEDIYPLVADVRQNLQQPQQQSSGGNNGQRGQGQGQQQGQQQQQPSGSDSGQDQQQGQEQGQEQQSNGQSGAGGQQQGQGQDGQEIQGAGQGDQGQSQGGQDDQGQGGSGKGIEDDLSSSKGVTQSAGSSNHMSRPDIIEKEDGDKLSKDAGYGDLSDTVKADMDKEKKKSIKQRLDELGIKKVGSGVGNMIDKIDASLEPVVDWENTLADLLKGLFDAPSSGWNKKYIPNDRYVRAQRPYGGESGNTIVISMDTSGSVSNKELKRFASETLGIIGEKPAIKNIILTSFDSEIHEIARLKPEDLEDYSMDKNIEAPGGGGTDIQAVLDYCENELEDMAINALIIFTDGYVDIPTVAPDNITDEDKSIIFAISTKDGFKNWEANCEIGQVIDVTGVMDKNQ